MNSIAASSTEPDSGISNPRVAVCLSGQTRTFLVSEVQASYAKFLHRPGYEYYISVDSTLPDLSSLKIAPVVGTYVDGGERLQPDARHLGNGHGDKTCPNATMGHLYLFPQTVRFATCHQLIRRRELQLEGRLYDYILRTRTDVVLHRPLPHPGTALSTQGRDIIIFDDQLSMARRVHADAILLSPLLAYRECHGAAHWSLSCNISEAAAQRTLERRGTPCTPMRLLLAYHPAPLGLLSCGFLSSTLPECSSELFNVTGHVCLATIARVGNEHGNGGKSRCSVPTHWHNGP